MEVNALNQQDIREYLLGRLSPEQQTLLEERLMVEDELYQELLIAEDELVDDYLHEELPPSSRASVESHFLAAPERQEKLRFARTFRKYAATSATSIEEEGRATAPANRSADLSDAQAPVPQSLPRLWGFLPTRNPMLGYALAAAVILIMVGVSWIVWRNLNAPRDPGRVLSFVLTPGLNRDDSRASNPVSLTGDTDTVRLQLLLPAGQYESYEATLIDRDSRTLATKPNLKSEIINGVPAAVVDIPADVLRADDYRVKLSGIDKSGNSENLATYSFRVQIP